jgi:pyridoxal phosphate enzyme (YggS family)
MSVKSNLNEILHTIPSGVKLVAVSKTNPAEVIQEAYNAGYRIFGESKVQELVPKYSLLPKDIEWHFIGHLQTNKIKYIAPFVYLIHSIDSVQLLQEVNKQAIKNNRIINCLLQVHIAEEETKFGFNETEISGIFSSEIFKELKDVRITGLMGMATLTENETQIRKEFQHLKYIFNEIKTSFMSNNPIFKDLSMGMSSDYLVAIEQGSTIVRVGSKIFGERIISNRLS